MPLYDYRCSECGNVIEVMHAIDGAGPAQCDVCGGPMRKALSPPAIHFKGSGWAKKDARTSPKKASTAASTASDTSGSETSTEGKSDAGQPGTATGASESKQSGTSADASSSSSAGSGSD